MRLIDADYIIEKETNTLRTLHGSTLPELIKHIGADDEYIIYTTELQSYANQKMMLAYLRSVLKNATTVDAVEIVRCKDCRHRGDSSKCPMMYPDNSPYYPDTDWTEDKGYCHRGERKNMKEDEDET